MSTETHTTQACVELLLFTVGFTDGPDPSGNRQRTPQHVFREGSFCWETHTKYIPKMVLHQGQKLTQTSPLIPMRNMDTRMMAGLYITILKYKILGHSFINLSQFTKILLKYILYEALF